MADTRIPVQKRSIEKKEKIITAGFELFCEKGYYKTNTIEIAKRAGVSTGALYSYFSDKRQIFIESFHQYLESISKKLLHRLNICLRPFNLSTFIEKWVNEYIDLYSKSNLALVQLRLMIAEDSEINHHFSDFENSYFSDIADLLKSEGINYDNLFEKVYISCILIDSLRQEKAAFSHNDLNFNVLKAQTQAIIYNILSK